MKQVAVGIGQIKQRLFLFQTHEDSGKLSAIESTDGVTFSDRPIPLILLSTTGEHEPTKSIKKIHIAKQGNTSYMLATEVAHDKTQTILAQSSDGITWQSLGTIADTHEPCVLIPDYTCNNEYILYTGSTAIHLSSSRNLKRWKTSNYPVLSPRPTYFDDSNLEVSTVMPTQNGIFLLYYSKKETYPFPSYAVGAALFDYTHPEHVLLRTDYPIWEQPEEWKTEELSPIGIIYKDKQLFLYWSIKNKGMYISTMPIPQQFAEPRKTFVSFLLRKFEKNPIIAPITKHVWESKATFNSAALHDQGKVHFIYRAIGDKDISVFGYAASTNGYVIDERLNVPVYLPTQPFESPAGATANATLLYISGGGYGGCEDPRITRIGNTVYLTYVAFDGWSPPRVALSSIDSEDFFSKDWKWATPKLISPPGVVDKNACILPERVKGKFVIFHRVFPNILVDFVDDLEFREYLKGDSIIPPSTDSWDSLKVGVGPPPLKTEDGWLTIYQAVGKRDSGKYKIGAMLLDEQNPAKVIARSKTPILEPTEHYENEGYKAGVAYPCGAAVIDGRLFVYYGGADTVVCVATAPLTTFLKQLKTNRPATLEPAQSRN